MFSLPLKQFLKEMLLDQLHEIKNSPHKIEPCTASDILGNSES
jgi:hypothetical protein